MLKCANACNTIDICLFESKKMFRTRHWWVGRREKPEVNKSQPPMLGTVREESKLVKTHVQLENGCQVH